ncbi:MAG: DUF2852 domain-containing protein [Pseudomonadota bacterium]
MSTLQSWFHEVVAWLDARGKGAWLTAMILGFIFIWPLGLAILFYMLWSDRMNHRFFKCKSSRMSNTTGNTAFDKYKEDTITRLNEEQTAFKTFLQRLRDAKDQTEFDQFMDERTAEQKAAKA